MRPHRVLYLTFLPAVTAASVAASLAVCHQPSAGTGGACAASPCAATDTQQVVTSEVVPPPISGGTLTITSDGLAAVVADPDRDRVLVVDLAARAIRGSFTTPPSAQPGRSVEGAYGIAYVALRQAGKIVAVDLATGGELASTDVCAAPRGLAFDGPRKELHVACAGGELLTFVATRAGHGKLTPRRSLLLDDDLRDVVVSGDTLLVSHFRSAVVDNIDSTGKLVRRAGPVPVVHDPVVFEPTVAWRMIGTPDGGALVIHQQSRRDPLDTPDSAPLPSGGTTVSVSAASTAATTGVSGGTTYGGAGCATDLVHSQVTLLAPNGAPPNAPGSGSVVGMSVPVDVARSRLGGFIAVLSAGRGRVREGAIDLVTGSDGCEKFDDASDPDPEGPAISEQSGTRLLPTAPEPIALAYGADDGVVVQIREPSMLEVHAPDTGIVVARIDLGGPSRFDTGHRMFHSTPDSTPITLSCASCHPEGRDDGHVWHFSDGFRRTQSLAGFPDAAGPFHWRGDLPNIATLVDTIYTERMGAEKQSVDRKQALLGYLKHLPNAPQLAGIDPASAQRGQKLFADPSVGCAACHSGPAFTNEALVDVGTGGAFKVASLVGVGSRAPYMHDGCAVTLQARFAGPCGGGDAHGHTSTLDDGAINDLVAYMQTL